MPRTLLSPLRAGSAWKNRSKMRGLSRGRMPRPLYLAKRSSYWGVPARPPQLAGLWLAWKIFRSVGSYGSPPPALPA